MINRDEAESITREYSNKDKNEILWDLYKPTINQLIIHQAKRGKTSAYIRQNDVNYLSNADFKQYVIQILRWSGYITTEENSNTIKISWD